MKILESFNIFAGVHTCIHTHIHIHADICTCARAGEHGHLQKHRPYRPLLYLMLEDYHGDNEEDEDGEENDDVHYKQPSQEGEVGQH